VRIKDSGVGISADMLDKIFDLFVQSNETIDRADGGMGVGLTLVKAIVELHGGTVVAESEGKNAGSQFTVRLPQLSDSQSHLTNSDASAASNGTIRCFRIAVVEDNADSRATLESLLQLDGHEVRTAPDGLQGINLISEWRPDLAIIDIGLPCLDGFEVAQHVRANQRNLKPFLIALTGYGFPADRLKVLSAGFDAHLVKPLKRTELNKLLVKLSRAEN
jgi:CheY-like chemotaxis protein